NIVDSLKKTAGDEANKVRLQLSTLDVVESNGGEHLYLSQVPGQMPKPPRGCRVTIKGAARPNNRWERVQAKATTGNAALVSLQQETGAWGGRPSEDGPHREGAMFGFAWLSVRQAQEAIRQGRLEEALRLLEQPDLRSHKNRGELVLALGRAFAERGERHL